MDAEEGSSMSARPVRRSGRTPAKGPAKEPSAVAPPESSAQGKRKAREPAQKSPAEKLDYLLTNPKSKLTKVDISDVINYSNFLELSEEAQNRLCALLPPTAFSTYSPSVCPTHPDYPSRRDDAQACGEDQMEVDDEKASAQSPATLDPTVFTSPFFLSAAHTFQDHLYSSWLGKKALDDLAKFREGALTGEEHADWKDEVWERNHQPGTSKTTAKGKRRTRPGLVDLAKRGLLQEGDVLAYKRTFPALNVTIEKDVLIDHIDPQTHWIGFVLSPGEVKSLPPSLLVRGSDECDATVLSMGDIADPVALERGVLDVQGRVRPSDKYAQDLVESGSACAPGEPSQEIKNAIVVRAWKSFTVWRWKEGMRDQTELQVVRERGGREKVATLFYLRACCSSSS
ncbi:Asx homology domain-containing protein [Trametes punicea]|nr:Asx homology domain-containing protein [Trametes punicea]